MYLNRAIFKQKTAAFYNQTIRLQVEVGRSICIILI